MSQGRPRGTAAGGQEHHDYYHAYHPHYTHQQQQTQNRRQQQESGPAGYAYPESNARPRDVIGKSKRAGQYYELLASLEPKRHDDTDVNRGLGIAQLGSTSRPSGIPLPSANTRSSTRSSPQVTFSPETQVHLATSPKLPVDTSPPLSKSPTLTPDGATSTRRSPFRMFRQKQSSHGSPKAGTSSPTAGRSDTPAVPSNASSPRFHTSPSFPDQLHCVSGKAMDELKRVEMPHSVSAPAQLNALTDPDGGKRVRAKRSFSAISAFLKGGGKKAAAKARAEELRIVHFDHDSLTSAQLSHTSSLANLFDSTQQETGSIFAGSSDNQSLSNSHALASLASPPRINSSLRHSRSTPNLQSGHAHTRTNSLSPSVLSQARFLRSGLPVHASQIRTPSPLLVTTSPSRDVSLDMIRGPSGPLGRRSPLPLGPPVVSPPRAAFPVSPSVSAHGIPHSHSAGASEQVSDVYYAPETTKATRLAIPSATIQIVPQPVLQETVPPRRLIAKKSEFRPTTAGTFGRPGTGRPDTGRPDTGRPATANRPTTGRSDGAQEGPRRDGRLRRLTNVELSEDEESGGEQAFEDTKEAASKSGDEASYEEGDTFGNAKKGELDEMPGVYQRQSSFLKDSPTSHYLTVISANEGDTPDAPDDSEASVPFADVLDKQYLPFQEASALTAHMLSAKLDVSNDQIKLTSTNIPDAVSPPSVVPIASPADLTFGSFYSAESLHDTVSRSAGAEEDEVAIRSSLGVSGVDWRSRIVEQFGRSTGSARGALGRSTGDTGQQKMEVLAGPGRPVLQASTHSYFTPIEEQGQFFDSFHASIIDETEPNKREREESANAHTALLQASKLYRNILSGETPLASGPSLDSSVSSSVLGRVMAAGYDDSLFPIRLPDHTDGLDWSSPSHSIAGAHSSKDVSTQTDPPSMERSPLSISNAFEWVSPAMSRFSDPSPSPQGSAAVSSLGILSSQVPLSCSVLDHPGNHSADSYFPPMPPAAMRHGSSSSNMPPSYSMTSDTSYGYGSDNRMMMTELRNALEDERSKRCETEAQLEREIQKSESESRESRTIIATLEAKNRQLASQLARK